MEISVTTEVVSVNGQKIPLCSSYNVAKGYAVACMLDENGVIIGKWGMHHGSPCVTPLKCLVRGLVTVG